MATHAVLAHPSQVVSKRDALRAGLENTRLTFHRLVDVAAGDRWHDKSAHSDWTMGEVLFHLTWALEQLPQEVAMARQRKGMFNIPKWIADPGSYWIVRWDARKVDPETLRRRYDAATDAAIAALESVPESDWELGAQFYGERFYSVADLFESPAHHLAQHTGQS